MGTIAKAFIGVFFLALVTLAGIGTTMAGAETSRAQNYHADVINEIECSNHNDAVMSACAAQASSEGYELTVTPVTYDDMGNMKTAEVVLKYQYGIPLFHLQKEKTIRGFAR